MKICNHCQATLEDEQVLCPVCGADPAEIAAEEEPVIVEEAFEISEQPAEETAEETVEETAEAAEEPAPKKKNRTGLIVGLALAAVLLVAVILLAGRKNTNAAAAGLHTNAYGYDSYSVHYATAESGEVTYSQMNEAGELQSVDAGDVAEKMGETVATCGEMTLTNQTLAYYYYQQIYSLQSTYGSYLPYMMDTTKAFDEQLSMDGDQTWQTFLITSSISQFQQIAALYQTATAEGMTLSEEEQAYLDSNTDFDTLAASYGLADGKALMEAQFGPGATPESYRAFMEIVMLANVYINGIYEELEISAEEISAYYDANVDMMLNSYGIEKIEKNVVDVRHILIQPAEGEDGTISDEAWAEAEAEAQRIYDEWLAGDATEDTFAELAGTYTQDPGSQTTGGLYEDVYPGQMVTEFNDWCFADGRQVGDHAIVKTTYGYHIMFFSGEGDYAYWEMASEELCRQEKMMGVIEELTAGFETTMTLENVLLLDSTAPSAPAAEEAAEAPAEETAAE